MANKYNVGDKVKLKSLPVKSKYFGVNQSMKQYFDKIVTIRGVSKNTLPDFFYYYIQEDDVSFAYEEDWFEDSKYKWEDL